MFERIAIDGALRREVYELSLRFSPPSINLRDAEIIDSYGDDSFANLHCHMIEHRIPDDVTRRDLDAYSMVWPFMKQADRIFYLFPVALEYERDNKLACIDFFLYNLDRDFKEGFNCLGLGDWSVLLLGLKWLWNAGPVWAAAWDQCLLLQEALGISLSFDDQMRAYEEAFPDSKQK